MKKNNISKKTIAICAFILASFVGLVKAQESQKFYLSGMWQFNFPIANNYANTGSGWGADMEGFYRFSPKIDGGVFVGWHTNNKYVDRKTYTEGNTAVTSDQYRSLFQLPFGLMVNYNLIQGKIEPYIGLKLGANYTEFQTYRNTFVNKEDNWGVFASPEIGVNFYPFSTRDIGFKASGYYGFASNRYKTFDVDYINNMGLRIGVIFEL